jgi:hypothetical protein
VVPKYEVLVKCRVNTVDIPDLSVVDLLITHRTRRSVCIIYNKRQLALLFKIRKMTLMICGTLLAIDDQVDMLGKSRIGLIGGTCFIP